MLVYLVDDDDVINYLNTVIIGQISSEIVIEVYKSGEAVLRHIQTCGAAYQPPDIMLLDIRMPEMDGFQLLEELDHFPGDIFSKTKIYMLSSTLDERDLIKAQSSRLVAGFSSKPLSIDHFQEILQKK